MYTKGDEDIEFDTDLEDWIDQDCIACEATGEWEYELRGLWFEWLLDPDNLEDPENTTQDLLNELANESDHIVEKVLFWPVGVEAGNVRNQGPSLITSISQQT